MRVEINAKRETLISWAPLHPSVAQISQKYGEFVSSQLSAGALISSNEHDLLITSLSPTGTLKKYLKGNVIYFHVETHS